MMLSSKKKVYSFNPKFILAPLIFKRTMHKVRAVTQNNLAPKISQSFLLRHKTTSVVKLKKKTDAAKDLAADDTGKHPHLLENSCIKQDCEKKKCTQLCDTLQSSRCKGFFTHKPIAGKFCRFLSDVDSNNQQDTQYFVKNPDQAKTINVTKAQTYYQQQQIKNDSKMDTYLKIHNLYDKLEE